MSWVLVISAVIVITVLAFFLVRRTQKGYCCGCGANPSDGQQTRLTCGSNCTWQSDPCSGGDSSSCDPPCEKGQTCTGGECTQDGGDLTCKDYTCTDNEGWIDKVNKNNIKCDDECTNSKCCTPDSARKLCSTKICQSPQVLISDAENVLCDDDDCTNCCESPTCSTSTEKCSRNKCPDLDKADETVTGNYDDFCCKDNLTCKDYLCPSGWKDRVKPGSITCTECKCTQETCCLPTCATESNSNTCTGQTSLALNADNISFDPTTSDFQKKCCINNTVKNCRDWFERENSCIKSHISDTNTVCNEQNCPRICCPNDLGAKPQCCVLGSSGKECSFGSNKDNCEAKFGKTKSQKCFWQDRINSDTGLYDCDLPKCRGSPTGKAGDGSDGSLKSCEDAYTKQMTCDGRGHYVPRRTNPGNSKPKYDKTVGHQCEWDSKGKCVTSDTWCKTEKS